MKLPGEGETKNRCKPRKRLAAVLSGVPERIWTSGPTLRSMAYRFVRRFEPCCLMLNFQRNSDIIYRHISCVIPWSTVWVSMVLGRPISKFLANNESHIMDRYSCCTELQCLDRERGLVLYSTCKWFLCLAHTLFKFVIRASSLVLPVSGGRCRHFSFL